MAIGVTGAGGGVGYSVVESLLRSPERPEIVGFDVSLRNPTMANLRRRALLPPVRDIEAYSQALLAEVERHEISVLVPGLDPELPIIASLRDRLLERGCIAVVSDAAVATLSADKLAFSTFGIERDLPVARAQPLSDAQAQAHDLSYPVIVKPIRGSASRGVRVAADIEELTMIVDDGTLVAQQYLPPRTLDGELVAVEPGTLDQSHELSVQIILDPDGGELGRFASLNRLKDGVPVDIEPVTDRVDLQGASEWVEALVPLGARGPINLQGRIGADGAPRYFELNARFTGITSLRGLLGFREVEATIGGFLGATRSEVQPLLRTRSRMHGFRPVGDVAVPQNHIVSITTESANQRSLGRVVVTGARGYLGASLCAALAECVDVTSIDLLDHAKPESWHDVLAGADTVMHLAGRRPDAGGSVDTFIASNVALTQSLLSASRVAGVSRVLLASTQAVYGTARPPLWSESLTPEPETVYGASKWSAELIGRAAADGGLDVVSVRLARLFGVGTGMRWTELPHVWSKKAVTGDEITIHGSGTQAMDLVNIHDAARAFIALGRSRSIVGGEAINVGGGRPVSLVELAETLATVADSRGLPALRIEHAESAAGAANFGMTIDRALECAGWKPEITLHHSMEQLVDAAMSAL